jgi:hypothetical protein
MKKFLTLSLIAALGLPLIGFAAAKEGKPAAAAAEVKTAKPFPYRGEVASVDASAKTFTFKNKDGKERVFSVAEKAEIDKDGAKADFAAVTVGAYAAGQCTKTAEGKFEATSVKIGAKPEKKGKGDPKAK